MGNLRFTRLYNIPKYTILLRYINFWGFVFYKTKQYGKGLTCSDEEKELRITSRFCYKVYKLQNKKIKEE